MNKIIKTTSRYILLFGFVFNITSIQGFALDISPANNVTTDKDIILTSLNQDQIIGLKTVKVDVTAYSSTPDQTDETPFIAASGEHVHEGMVAANFLAFGTKIKIPSIFGDKIFIVNDRMNRRFNSRIDVWFPNRESAINFGLKTAEIVIL